MHIFGFIYHMHILTLCMDTNLDESDSWVFTFIIVPINLDKMNEKKLYFQCV